MLAELRMELQTDSKEFGYYQSSNMQGILMERMNPRYAEFLHEQGLHPYSQYLEIGEKMYWVIKTLDREAYNEIILPWMDCNVRELEIKKKNIKIQLNQKKVSTVEKQELLQRFYQNECDRYLHMEFLTSTSFKRNGVYQIFPDIRLIYQSLMNKYSATCNDMEMFDEQVLQELVEKSTIVGYKLNSTKFPIERIRIPSFKGEIDIKIDGTETMARYARFLAEFGEYSGVGIKTAMGMGAMKIIYRRAKR